ncbi:DUF4225 domain-containing protein [Paramixta manurensis]|uniref:DUF4225 domain-containing protein n=1 Tax=Paramixta manurensis TaxID=2740817 RepID=A0A6M8UC93_9GAMM|nr:DUF4225 domain-containing protein [Erwiniaceae bacterium PD-1]
MDNYWNEKRFSSYYLTMANLEANQLTGVANTISLIHLKDGFVRIQFQDNIKSFINAQINAIRYAKSEKECQVCLQNIQQEREYLTIQDRMLRSGEAALHASIALVKTGDVWGYIIKGVAVVLSGLQIAAGIGVMMTLNPAGLVFGAMLTAHGFNGVQESFENMKNETDSSVGFLKEGYRIIAQFIGCDRRMGEIAYHSMDIALSAYGIFRLTLKPQSWRLFHYLNQDYVRNFNNMTSLELGIEIGNDTASVKSIYELINDKR